MAQKAFRSLLTLLLAAGHAAAWAATPPADTLAARQAAHYAKLGKDLTTGLVQGSNINLLQAIFPVMVLAAFVSRLLDLRTWQPRWRHWLRWLWVPAAGGFAATVGHRNLAFADGYLLFGYGVLALLLWQRRGFRPATTVLWALVPLALYSLSQLSLHLGSWQLRPAYAEYPKLWRQANLLMMSGLLVLAFAQKRSQAKADAQQAETEAARQQIATRNAELERLVAERRAALQQQADELQTALAELQATQAQLIQSEKMASLGELTAGIAHEIQNPLNFVNNFADVSAELVAELETEQASATPDLTLEAELLADLQHNLHKINLHGQRASSIVRGMLAHSRQGSGERQPTNLNALADEYLRLAYHGLRAKDKTFNATLDTDFAPVLPLVEAVPGDLGRVLLNLFTNAFYAVQQRQQAAGPGYQPTVRVRTWREADEVVVQVRDNGTGIPEAARQKIFQPFFTTKPSGEGTGLGLSLAHDIVVQGHGGTLAVNSQPGEFTEFVVRLPFRT